jgi:hypothetical protein
MADLAAAIIVVAVLALLALGLACGFLFRRFRRMFSGFGDAG